MKGNWTKAVAFKKKNKTAKPEKTQHTGDPKKKQ